MKKLILIATVLITPIISQSKTISNPSDTIVFESHNDSTITHDTIPDDNQEIYVIVEKAPVFPGGNAQLYKYLGENINYPEKARDENIQGRVYVSFVIEVDGSITDVRIIRGLSKECDEEVIRVITSMPKWTPGEQRGKKVRVRYNLPVVFKLEGKSGKENKKKKKK